MHLAEERADIAINYQSTKDQAEKLSKLIDQMGMMDEFDRLSLKIDLMETKENAKEGSELIDSMGITCNRTPGSFTIK